MVVLLGMLSMHQAYPVNVPEHIHACTTLLTLPCFNTVTMAILILQYFGCLRCKINMRLLRCRVVIFVLKSVFSFSFNYSHE